MKSKRKLYPGESGTKRLVKKYGDKLICVRYRYDELKGKRYNTVELIEKESVWKTESARIPVNKLMHLRVSIKEAHVQSLIKKAGGRWNYRKKYRELAYREVVCLGLENRIIK
jgi:hypothetical protein